MRVLPWTGHDRRLSSPQDRILGIEVSVKPGLAHPMGSDAGQAFRGCLAQSADVGRCGGRRTAQDAGDLGELGADLVLGAPVAGAIDVRQQPVRLLAGSLRGRLKASRYPLQRPNGMPAITALSTLTPIGPGLNRSGGCRADAGVAARRGTAHFDVAQPSTTWPWRSPSGSHAVDRARRTPRC